MIQLVKLPVQKGNAPLRIAKGHFVTNHSHINYYIDITYQKTRISEAKDSAYQLVSNFINDTPVDTILCLDGTAVLGTCIADELTKSGFRTINAHQTIYVVEPEYNANSQIIFRDNVQPMIRGKHVLVLMASVSTGFTAKRSIEAIEYYGGRVAGVAAIYRAVDQGIHLAASLAVGALVVVIAFVIGQIVHGIDRTDRITCDFIHRTVNSSNTGNAATVVLNGFDGTLCSITGCDRCHQNQNVLAAEGA